MGQELECLIFDCYKKRKPKCCHYCATKHTCRSACMNSPERCGQVIQREEKRTETSGQNRVQSRQTFYTAESDEGFCQNYIKLRRI